MKNRALLTRVALGVGALALLGGFFGLRSSVGLSAPAAELPASTAIAPPVFAAPGEPAPVVFAPAPHAHTELAGYDPKQHAHPITAEHLRRYREVDLLDGAWLALRKRSFAKARDLVTTHRNEYPGSSEHMDEGLLLLADCMEHPGGETRARAQHFYDTKTYSPMRRRLRRLCLEQVVP